ncbi:hypothetical protein [Streptomyces sp. CB03238]|uniref:antibiotic biosynthesis monooxygenase family protein n=1 Tax=Streptomyces sp. CB03238 TaxID=1907777 RepID=UPI000A0FA2BA|nr:hypothetical protein [Streptomyces sp. CB03238]ORT56555.1 hypothetical protein BKD26_27465 [Streptomyces sp. CB03238]
MPHRDLGGPITVINRFTVKGDTGTFEREFRDHSQFIRRREDFHFLVTVRLVDRPQEYVHMGHWRSLRGFLGTVHDDTFLDHVQRLGATVETEADQALSVQRVLRENAVVGAENVVLTWARVTSDRRAFEKRFDEVGERCTELGGFGGSDLMRSTLRPMTYTGIQWWRDTEDCDRALADAEYQAALRALAEVAEVTTERTRHVAYERVIG